MLRVPLCFASLSREPRPEVLRSGNAAPHAKGGQPGDHSGLPHGGPGRGWSTQLGGGFTNARGRRPPLCRPQIVGLSIGFP